MARYIDADSLLDRIEKYCGDYSRHGEKAFDKNAVRITIKAAPTADVAPVVHAHWTYPAYAPDGGSYVTKRCSHCGWEILYSEERGSFQESKRCPDCGAFMDEKG